MVTRKILYAARERLGRTVGSALDAAFVRQAFKSPTLSVTDEIRTQVQQRLAEARTFYANADLFPEVSAASLEYEDRSARLGGGGVIDAMFQTPHRGLHDVFVKTLSDVPRAAQVRIRWFRHDRPAPAAIVLHGWGMGHPNVDSQAFAARALYAKGLDTIFIPAPFHGTRLPRGKVRPQFPTSRPIRATEGFAMWIADVRAMVKTVRERGAARVGVVGMSMGGFAASLLATTEPELDFVVPMVPFSDLPRLMWNQARHNGGLANARNLGVDEATFAAAFNAIAPLRRKQVIASERIHVFGNRYDRVTPVDHARALARHFDCAYTELPGSHLMQLGRREVFREMLRRAFGPS